ncbi:PAAR-like protein [Chitinophaga sp. YIM B06452]|uniref:PAAR-like protein n=1 Tax=Chitinophaga sp. YIM B06452 TaxID=3082158 RepID=UPI0031FE8BAB
MGSKKYIPANSWLTCDKGSAPSRLLVTHHNNTRIYGENLASEMDMVPGENIFPMGSCSVTGGACKPDPIYWDKCNEGVKVNGYKLVFEDACLLCKQGGKVKVDFDVPSGGSTAAAATTGLGFGMNSGGMFLGENFAESAKALKDIEKEYFRGKTVDEIAASKGDFKRMYGEERVKMDLKAKGYVINSTDMGRGQNGLDIGAKDVKGTTDIVADGKFATRGGKPKLAGTKRSGKQLGDHWLSKGQTTGTSRVQQSLPADDAARVLDKVNTNDPSLKRLAAGVDPEGKISYHEVDRNGNVGNKVNLEPANVVRGGSKAANTINSVSRSIQGTKAVSAANDFLVRNASTVSKVGKVVGRGAIVVGIVMEGYNIYSAYQEEGHFGEKTKEATGSAVGALGGALVGAKIGAAVGALGGPVGIIVGGVVGGIIGGIAGSSIGGWIGSLF